MKEEPTGQQPEAKLTDADKQWLAGWSVETPPTEYDSAFLTGAEAGIRYARKQLQAEVEALRKENERLKHKYSSVSDDNMDLDNRVTSQAETIKRLREALNDLVLMYEDQVPTYAGHEVLEAAKSTLGQ